MRFPCCAHILNPGVLTIILIQNHLICTSWHSVIYILKIEMQLFKEYDNVKILSTDLDFSLNSWFVECKICSFLIGTKIFLHIRCISRIKSGLEYLHYVQKLPVLALVLVKRQNLFFHRQFSALHECLFTSHIICFINSEFILPNWYRWYCKSPFAPRCVVSRFSSALINKI